MSNKYLTFQAASLLALDAAIAAGVSYSGPQGHAYYPMPNVHKHPGRPMREGTYTRTGAVPRARNRFIQQRRAEVRALEALATARQRTYRFIQQRHAEVRALEAHSAARQRT